VEPSRTFVWEEATDSGTAVIAYLLFGKRDYSLDRELHSYLSVFCFNWVFELVIIPYI
jgi:hypothetical protein